MVNGEMLIHGLNNTFVQITVIWLGIFPYPSMMGIGVTGKLDPIPAEFGTCWAALQSITGLIQRWTARNSYESFRVTWIFLALWKETPTLHLHHEMNSWIHHRFWLCMHFGTLPYFCLHNLYKSCFSKGLFINYEPSNALGWPNLLFLSMGEFAVPLNADRQTAEVANHSVRAALMKHWRTEIDLSASCALVLSEQLAASPLKLNHGYKSVSGLFFRIDGGKWAWVLFVGYIVLKFCYGLIFNIDFWCKLWLIIRTSCSGCLEVHWFLWVESANENMIWAILIILKKSETQYSS